MAKPGPAKINHEAMAARFPKGTFERIDGARREGENRTDFLRAAIETELQIRATGASPHFCKDPERVSEGA